MTINAIADGGVCTQHVQAMPGCLVDWQRLGDDSHCSLMLGRYPRSATVSLPHDVAVRMHTALGQYISDHDASLSGGKPVVGIADGDGEMVDLAASDTCDVCGAKVSGVVCSACMANDRPADYGG